MRFNDMTDEQKAKAVEHNRNIHTSDSSWYHEEYEEYKEDLEKMGFGHDIDLQFSGFCSQGDGASFATKHMDIERILRHFKIWSKYKSIHRFIRDEQIKYEIYRHNIRAVHSNSMTINDSYYFDETTAKQQAAMDDLYDTVLQIARDEADKIYRKLESLCEWYESDEFLMEHFEINDYNFCECHFDLS